MGAFRTVGENRPPSSLPPLESGEKRSSMPLDFRLRQYAGIPLRLGTFTDLLQMLQLRRGRYVSAAAAGIQMLGRWQ